MRNMVGNISRSPKNLFLALTVIVLVTGGALWAIGASVQRAYWLDDLIMLDGAWRVLQGYRPHLDFHTTLGPLTFIMIAGGMKLVGPCVSAIACTNSILFAVISFWAWGLSRPRMSALSSFLSALCAGLTVAGTSCFGYGYLNIPYTGYAALYNRYGEAFTALVLIEALWPLRQPGPGWRASLGGFSTGAALALLFFLKINFFGVALLGILTGAILVPFERGRWIGLVTGLLLTSAIMLTYLRFDVLAIGNDLSMAVLARLGREGSQWPRILHALNFTLVQVYLLICLWWLAPIPARASRTWLNPKAEQALLVGYVLAAQLLLLWSNGQIFSSTLFAWGALLLLDRGDVSPGTGKSSGQAVTVTSSSRWPAWLIAAVPIGLVIFANITSIALSTGLRLTTFRRTTVEQKFASPSMSDLLGVAPSEVAAVNEGFELVRRWTGPRDRVLALQYVNPFSFGLLRPSPTGDSVWWDEHATYSPSHHPDPGKVFSNVDAVVVPVKDADAGDTARLIKIYGEELLRYFKRTAESEHWILYRRAQASTNGYPPTLN